ncbi:hypothetical protein A1O3_00110 [Capronia epimyces CBS 606.96]|uniref:Uncharacterized protein n=1 Tax=Capronia epimyces CBS 606.96 TaxID=1182542 RepID=W9YF99_9EURO|nr:uncharacterized protein A1O3_00110 [Capronia epimyces CBS 606.96]EXJ91562.1 hypothetical protein A1O3_00110 [Capronia epimyces CBS 606.96]
MRFFRSLITFGIVALVAAQDLSLTSSSATSVASSSPTLDAQTRCLQKSACVNVPCPSQLQANATTDCAAQCPQGNGTQSETEQYASCQASCISSYFLSTGTPAPSATASPGSGTVTSGGSAASTTGGSAASRGSAATGASAPALATGSSSNGANGLHLGMYGLGCLGLVITGLAL